MSERGPNVVGCPNCGAPVDASQSLEFVRCAYCGANVDLGERRRVDVQPIRTVAPKPVSRTTYGIVIATFALVMLVSFGLSLAMRKSPPRVSKATPEPSGAPSAKLTGLTMDMTPQQVAAWAGQPLSDSISIDLRDSRFASIVVGMSRDKQKIDDVMAFARSPIVPGDPIVKQLADVLGREFTQTAANKHAYDSNGAYVSIQDNTLRVSVSGDPPGRAQRLAALWDLLRSVILEQPVRLSAEDRRDWLGTGYPWHGLLGINPTVGVDSSKAHMLGLFRGAIWDPGPGGALVYELTLDHPSIGTARLTWENSKAGKMMDATFGPAAKAPTFKNQRGMSECLSKKLGKPQERVTDHLAHEVMFYWPTPHLGAVVLYKGYLGVRVDQMTAVPPATWAAMIGALDGCNAL